jgi:hypothetical protein
MCLTSSKDTELKFCEEISLAKQVRKTFPNRQLGMKVNMKLVMIMEID